MGSVLLGEVFQACPAVDLVLAGHTHRQRTVQVGRITAMTSPVGYVAQWDGSTPEEVACERLTVVELT
jgi:predicted phosphodiesterase